MDGDGDEDDAGSLVGDDDVLELPQELEEKAVIAPTTRKVKKVVKKT